MRQSFSLIFIIGGISLAVIAIIALTFFKSTPQAKDEINPTKETLALMQTADSKNEEAKKILSKRNPTEDDQKKAKQLLDETLSDAKKMTEMQPKSPATWHFLGQVYRELIDINPKAEPFAEDALKKAIELNPENPTFYDDLATIYIIVKKYTEAEEVLKETIAIDPNRANPYFKLGNIYKDKKDKEKAREFYLKAKSLTPDTHATNSALIQAQLQSLGE